MSEEEKINQVQGHDLVKCSETYTNLSQWVKFPIRYVALDVAVEGRSDNVHR